MSNQDQKYKTLKHYNTPGHAHELTFSCYHRYDYLCDATACNIFLRELDHSRQIHHFQLWAYVLMPTHVHILILPMHSQYDIAKMLNDTKGRMAKSYRDHILKNVPGIFDRYAILDKSKSRTVFRFWQPGGGFDRNLWNGMAIYNSIEYIEANPVRRKLVSEPTEYHWSSAYARKNNTGLIPDRFNIPVAMLNPQIQRIGAL